MRGNDAIISDEHDSDNPSRKAIASSSTLTACAHDDTLLLTWNNDFVEDKDASICSVC